MLQLNKNRTAAVFRASPNLTEYRQKKISLLFEVIFIYEIVFIFEVFFISVGVLIF